MTDLPAVREYEGVKHDINHGGLPPFSGEQMTRLRDAAATAIAELKAALEEAHRIHTTTSMYEMWEAEEVRASTAEARCRGLEDELENVRVAFAVYMDQAMKDRGGSTLKSNRIAILERDNAVLRDHEHELQTIIETMAIEGARLGAESEKLQAGIWERAYAPPDCKHANNLYAHCLACEVERLQQQFTIAFRLHLQSADQELRELLASEAGS